MGQYRGRIVVTRYCLAGSPLTDTLIFHISNNHFNICLWMWIFVYELTSSISTFAHIDLHPCTLLSLFIDERTSWGNQLCWYLIAWGNKNFIQSFIKKFIVSTHLFFFISLIQLISSWFWYIWIHSCLIYALFNDTFSWVIMPWCLNV